MRIYPIIIETQDKITISQNSTLTTYTQYNTKANHKKSNTESKFIIPTSHQPEDLDIYQGDRLEPIGGKLYGFLQPKLQGIHVAEHRVVYRGAHLSLFLLVLLSSLEFTQRFSFWAQLFSCLPRGFC